MPCSTTRLMRHLVYLLTGDWLESMCQLGVSTCQEEDWPVPCQNLADLPPGPALLILSVLSINRTRMMDKPVVKVKTPPLSWPSHICTAGIREWPLTAKQLTYTLWRHDPCTFSRVLTALCDCAAYTLQPLSGCGHASMMRASKIQAVVQSCTRRKPRGPTKTSRVFLWIIMLALHYMDRLTLYRHGSSVRLGHSLWREALQVNQQLGLETALRTAEHVVRVNHSCTSHP